MIDEEKVKWYYDINTNEFKLYPAPGAITCDRMKAARHKSIIYLDNRYKNLAITELTIQEVQSKWI